MLVVYHKVGLRFVKWARVIRDESIIQDATRKRRTELVKFCLGIPDLWSRIKGASNQVGRPINNAVNDLGKSFA